jgi:hypothetical protein
MEIADLCQAKRENIKAGMECWRDAETILVYTALKRVSFTCVEYEIHTAEV